MSRIQRALKKSEDHCQQQGLRLTTKRKLVLESLLHSKKALSTYELAEICSAQQDTTMPAMSIYRILEFLEKEQFVHKLSIANKYVACAHLACDHAHEVSQFIICSQCQMVKEMTITKVTLAQLNQSAKDAGFELASPHFEMQGVCKKCR